MAEVVRDSISLHLTGPDFPDLVRADELQEVPAALLAILGRQLLHT
jgi:hypothetical protein